MKPALQRDPSCWPALWRRLLVCSCAAVVLLGGGSWRWPRWQLLRQQADATGLSTELDAALHQLQQARAVTRRLEARLAAREPFVQRLTPSSWLPELQRRAEADGLRVERLEPAAAARQQASGLALQVAFSGSAPQMLRFLDGIQRECDGVQVEQQQLSRLDDGRLQLRGDWTLQPGSDPTERSAAPILQPTHPTQSTPPTAAAGTPRLAAWVRVGNRAELVLQQGDRWLHRRCAMRAPSLAEGSVAAARAADCVTRASEPPHAAWPG